MSNPLVSIVIPTYNRAIDLDRALKSVLSQTYMNWEAVIIDNCSTDNTDEVIFLLNDSRLKLFKIHNDGVIAASRNEGVRQSLGKYVAFLDSDDWWLPTKLEKSVGYLEQGFDIVYHDLFLAKKHNQKFFWKKTNSRDLTRPVFNDLVLKGNALNNSSVVIKRSVLIKINYFIERKELVAIEDYDGWLRTAKITDKFKKIPETLGYYWVGGGNTSGLMRTIKVTEMIEDIYMKEILALNIASHHYFNYVKGRAYYLLRNKVEAKKYLGKIHIDKGLPVTLYLKSKLMMFLLL